MAHLKNKSNNNNVYKLSFGESNISGTGVAQLV